MRTTSLAVLSALSLLLASGSASAQSRLTLNDDGSTPRKETTRLALARDVAGPILKSPQRTARSRDGLPALRRKSKTTARAARRDVRISQVPRNAPPGEAAAQPAYPRPPLLRRSRDVQQSDSLDPPQPPPELTGEDEFLLPDESLPTLRAEIEDLGQDETPPAEEDYHAGDAPLINHPHQGYMADFFLPPQPCEVRDYWTDYCSGGYGGHRRWLHALGWAKKRGCRAGHCRTGHCRTGRCHSGNCGCKGDCGCDHGGSVPVPEPDVESETDVLLPPAPMPMPPRNDIPEVRVDDDRPPRG